jgi:hypothetical protein
VLIEARRIVLALLASCGLSRGIKTSMCILPHFFKASTALPLRRGNVLADKSGKNSKISFVEKNPFFPAVNY